MKKKMLGILIGVGILLTIGIIILLIPKNNPDYVIKQYVKANNSKNQKILEKIIYLEDGLVLYDIDEAYNKGCTSKIVSYNYWKTPSEDSAVFYCEYEDGEKHGLVNIRLVDNKWKVIYAPLVHK